MIFSLVANQHGTLVASAVQQDGTASPSGVTNESASVDDATLLTVTPNAGFPDQFIVKALGKVGTATVTVTGKNVDGVTVSTPFVFQITAIPPTPGAAIGFTGALQNVANN